jgi:cytochrome c biogenesis protein CcmG/thiol:disulfide interchange protein DsbE
MRAPPPLETPRQNRRWVVALPLVGFIALAGLFLMRLHGGDPSKSPSALIGRPAPPTALPALEGLVSNGMAIPGLDPAAFKGKVSVVNVWASWCVPCHDEMPLLTALAKDKRLQIVGINYKDSPDNARRFLGRYGNPFGIVGVDGNGRASIEWGVYGVPEIFVVGRDGTIVYKLVGPITPQNVDRVLKAEIEKALKAGS